MLILSNAAVWLKIERILANIEHTAKKKAIT